MGINPMKFLKNIDLSGLSKVLESLHAYQEKLLEEAEKHTKQNEEIIRILENIKNK